VTSPLQAWKERIAACRRQRQRPDAEHWRDSAGWYRRWVRANDYVEGTLPSILPALPEGGRMLEIGPGTGAFTRPLAHRAGEVLALEPSPAMREELTRGLQEAGLDHVRVLPGTVEESLGKIQPVEDYHLTLASFALYNVAPIDRVIAGLLSFSRCLVILLGTGAPSAWSQRIYRELKGEPRVIPPQLDLLYPVLLAMGLYAEVDIIPTSQHYVFSDREELLDWWMDKYSLDSNQRRPLAELLEPLIEKRNGQVGIYRRRQLALVRLEREKQTSWSRN